MEEDLTDFHAQLRQLTRTDSDPRARHRAHVLLLVAEGQTVYAVARLFGTAGHRVRTWRKRFLAARRVGLLDLPRVGTAGRQSKRASGNSCQKRSEIRVNTHGLGNNANFRTALIPAEGRISLTRHLDALWTVRKFMLRQMT